MKVEEFNAFCAALPHTSHVVQWGGAHVWKVAGKVFAIGGWSGGDQLAVTFKTSKIAFEVLREEPGLRPAPYLASRGMTWIQRVTDQSMSDRDLEDHIRESYRLVAKGLPAKTRASLGLVL